MFVSNAPFLLNFYTRLLFDLNLIKMFPNLALGYNYANYFFFLLTEESNFPTQGLKEENQGPGR